MCLAEHLKEIVRKLCWPTEHDSVTKPIAVNILNREEPPPLFLEPNMEGVEIGILILVDEEVHFTLQPSIH